jgi:hypothetical protein
MAHLFPHTHALTNHGAPAVHRNYCTLTFFEKKRERPAVRLARRSAPVSLGCSPFPLAVMSYGMLPEQSYSSRQTPRKIHLSTRRDSSRTQKYYFTMGDEDENVGRHRPGSIKRIKLHNFLTHGDIEFWPGPRYVCWIVLLSSRHPRRRSWPIQRLRN